MHSIERYGVVALVFLVVTIVAVLTWERGDGEDPSPDSAWTRPMNQVRAAESVPEPQNGVARDPFVTLSTRPRPLRRELEDADTTAPRSFDDAPGEHGPGLRGRAARAVDVEQQARSEPTRAELPVEGARLQPARTAGRSQPIQRPERRIYVVQKGDTLSEIALRQVGTSKRWKEIVDLNPGLNPNKLKVGARLRIPDRGADTPQAPVAALTRSAPERASSAVPAGESYRVQSGDSLWKIAARALGDGERWPEIEELNPGIDPNRLKVGQALLLPEGASPAKALVAQASPVATSAGRAASGSKKGRVR